MGHCRPLAPWQKHRISKGLPSKGRAPLKPWDIENRIIAEVSTIKNSHAELKKTATSLSSHESVVESIIFQGQLYHARTGSMPSKGIMEEAKKDIHYCLSSISQSTQIDEKVRDYALSQTSAMMIESRSSDKQNANAYFQFCVAEASSTKIAKDIEVPSKALQISVYCPNT